MTNRPVKKKAAMKKVVKKKVKKAAIKPQEEKKAIRSSENLVYRPIVNGVQGVSVESLKRTQYLGASTAQKGRRSSIWGSSGTLDWLNQLHADIPGFSATNGCCWNVTAMIVLCGLQEEFANAPPTSTPPFTLHLVFDAYDGLQLSVTVARDLESTLRQWGGTLIIEQYNSNAAGTNNSNPEMLDTARNHIWLIGAGGKVGHEQPEESHLVVLFWNATQNIFRFCDGNDLAIRTGHGDASSFLRAPPIIRLLIAPLVATANDAEALFHCFQNAKRHRQATVSNRPCGGGACWWAAACETVTKIVTGCHVRPEPKPFQKVERSANRMPSSMRNGPKQSIEVLRQKCLAAMPQPATKPLKVSSKERKRLLQLRRRKEVKRVAHKTVMSVAP